MNDSVLKICAVSLSGMQKAKALAVYDGERLLVTHIALITGTFGAWKKPLVEEIEKRRAEGYVCIVEEKTDHLAQYASQFELEAIDGETGRSNFYTALDWYFALLEMGNLIVAPEYQQYVIRLGGEGQKIEKGQDDKGRVTYSVNWNAITAGHRALLLCVVGAMIEPVSDRYVEDMLKMWLPINIERDPLQAAFAMAEKLISDRAEEFEKNQKERQEEQDGGISKKSR